MTTKIWTCKLCQKTFASYKSYWTHTQRKKMPCITNEQCKKMRDEFMETKKNYEALKKKHKKLKYDHNSSVSKENIDNNRILSFLILLMKKDVTLFPKFGEILKTADSVTHNTIKQFVDLLKTNRYVPEKVKKQIYVDQEYKCFVCCETLPATCEIDHIIPLWQGGSNQKENLQGLCCTCHSEKTVEDTTKFYFDVCLLYNKIN